MTRSAACSFGISPGSGQGWTKARNGNSTSFPNIFCTHTSHPHPLRQNPRGLRNRPSATRATEPRLPCKLKNPGASWNRDVVPGGGWMGKSEARSFEYLHSAVCTQKLTRFIAYLYKTYTKIYVHINIHMHVCTYVLILMLILILTLILIPILILMRIFIFNCILIIIIIIIITIHSQNHNHADKIIHIHIHVHTHSCMNKTNKRQLFQFVTYLQYIIQCRNTYVHTCMHIFVLSLSSC